MSFTTPTIDWAAFAPIIIVLGAGAAGILIEAFIKTPATRRTVQARAVAGRPGLRARRHHRPVGGARRRRHRGDERHGDR
ncbi:hypothetical protein [Demequina litorisediminis]|uniref:Uncharacterized protein n=1 Tax=Demequina litorisediminis TaxID=1849022 RepID=A0ABQ6IFP1_9MICO|nr:hypothetical protein [Demequina litorisediminis]GMA36105.1 hypothetical protein GCM10025876_23090 [Demequina litorisediminis]